VRGRLRTRLHVHMSRTRLDILPLAESVRWRGKLLPRYGWYMLSGAVCDVGQFALYKLLWTTFGLPTMAWTAAYVLSIAMRQETHKVFVFGHYEGAWYKNLWRFYCVYFLTVATSMPVNLLLVRLMAFLPHQLTALGIAENTYVRAARRPQQPLRHHHRSTAAPERMGIFDPFGTEPDGHRALCALAA